MTLAEMPALPLVDTPLGRTIATTATDIWNDSCAIDELEYAIAEGVGTINAVANVPARYLDYARTLGTNAFGVYSGVVLPADVPALVLSDAWRTSVPIPTAQIRTHVLLSVFLV